jgi:hypothetical protein
MIRLVEDVRTEYIAAECVLTANAYGLTSFDTSLRPPNVDLRNQFSPSAFPGPASPRVGPAFRSSQESRFPVTLGQMLYALFPSFISYLDLILGRSEVQRVVIAYIVDLIRVLIELFNITIRAELALTTTERELYEAFEAYVKSSSRQRIHDRIRSMKRMMSTGEISREIRWLLDVN